jgi:hypothetical protein
MKIPFSFIDGPMLGCTPANGISVDASLIGIDPTPGDKRFICSWRRDKAKDGKSGLARGLYKFVRDEDGKVTAHHVPGADDLAFDEVKTEVPPEVPSNG